MPAPTPNGAAQDRTHYVAPAPKGIGAPDPPSAMARRKGEADRSTQREAALRPTPPLTRSLPSAAFDQDRLRAARSTAPNALGGIPEPMPPQPEEAGRDRFEGRPVAGFKPVREAPVSTFSIDVDTAAYGFLRASLARNALPQPDSVRVEELINYFPYGYAPAKSAQEPFAVTARLFPSPWAEGRKILRVGIKGYELQQAGRPAANLVFLIDTSGSMSGQNRLPLVKQALSLLVAGLGANDRVAIVTYAGGAGTLLEPTPASEKGRILSAIEGLKAGGGTAGGEGLRQAYALAARNHDARAVNRVMLMTDGDFNIGIASREELTGFVEREREKGVFLSVLGFGMGNYNDALMQALAQNGNGVAAYIDTLNEARKVLVEEASASLFPIAKDVKIQVEFNPATVSEYRLIGYETRMLNREDFSNDKVDAGEVGSGQGVTALYELVPKGGPRTVSDLRYGTPDAARAMPKDAGAGAMPDAGRTEEYAFVKLRYKLPDEETSRLIETPVGPAAEAARLAEADEDSRFAAAVAGFGEILRGGRWTGRFGLDDVLRLASGARGEDPYGYRSEFLQLVRAAKTAQALQAARP